MLIAPHQFYGPNYLVIQPFLMVCGALFFSLGVALITTAALRPQQWLCILVHIAAGTGFGLLAFSLFQVGSWTGFANYTVWTTGMVLAPWLERFRAERSTATRAVDMFVVVTALSAMTNGAIMFLHTTHYTFVTYARVQEYLSMFGLLFSLSGLLLLVTQLKSDVPRWLIWLAHLATATVFWTWMSLTSVSARAWTGVIFYGGSGLLLVLLPWVAHRIYAVDPRSLRTRLALLLGLIAGLPLVIATAIISHHEEETATQQALREVHGVAHTLARDIADFMTLQQFSVRTLAAQPGVLELTPEAQQGLLQAVSTNDQHAHTTAIVDVMGNVVARSDDGPLSNIARLPLFQQTLSTNADAFMVMISPSTGYPVVALTSPLRGVRGEFAGLVALTVDMTRLDALLAPDNGSHGTRVYLVDSGGRLLAHANDPEVTTFTDLSLLPGVVAVRQNQGTAQAFTYGLPGAKQLVGFARVPNLPWGVVVEQSRAALLAPSRAGRDLAFGLLLLGIAGAVTFGLLASRTLISPLGMLARATRAFANGQEDAPVPQSQLSEVAHLTSAFSEMRDRLVTRTAERAKAEEALRESEEHLKAIFSQVTVGIAQVDLAGRYLMVNDRYCAIVGRSRDELLTLRMQDITYPEDLQLNVPLFEEITKGGQSFTLEKRYVRPDGQHVWVNNSVALLRNRQGQPQSVVAVTLDITQMRAAEEERRRAELQHAIAENTERERRRLGRELHDGIRQQLVGIRMLSANLQKKLAAKNLPEANLMADFTELVSDANMQVRELINGLVPVHIDAEHLVPALQRAAANIEQWYGIPCQVYQNGPVRVDKSQAANQLFHIAQEALANAAKYSKATEINLFVTMTDDILALQVCDNGTGLPEDFDKRGGMGFTNMRYRAELIGAQLQVASEPDKGTTIVCTLSERRSPFLTQY